MWDFGVVMKSTGAIPVVYQWQCLCHGDCGTIYNLGKSCTTSAVTKHLKNKHGIDSISSLAMKKNKLERIEKTSDLVKSALYVAKCSLAVKYQMAKATVFQALPHCHYEHEEQRLLAEGSCKDFVAKDIHSKKMIHRITEIYVSMHKNMKKSIKKTLKSSHLPLLHIIMDEWCCKLQLRCYIAIRVQYVDEEWNLKSHLLSLRNFDRGSMPDHYEMASQVLYDWLRGTFQEFGINSCDVYSSTTDSGPDIRWMCEKITRCKWELTIDHLIARAVKEALDLDGSENPVASEIFKSIASIRTVITGSKYLVAYFQKAMWEH